MTKIPTDRPASVRIVLGSALFSLAFFGVTATMAVLMLPVFVGPPRLITVCSRVWARTTMALLRLLVGLDYRVIGGENLPDRPAIFAIKHQSAWDTIALNLVIRDPVYILKRELFLIPFFGWYLWRAGNVGIDRSAGPSALRRVLRGAKEAIANGRNVIIFPEGTRTAPGQRKPYNPGVAALYSKLGRPLVPVALDSGLFWARRSFLKRPGTITIAFLEPVPPGLDRKQFMATLEDRIETGCRALAGPGAS